MNSRMKKMENLLIVGVVIIFLAGFSILYSETLSKTLIAGFSLAITILFYGLNYVLEKYLKLEHCSKLCWGLAFVNTIITLIYIGSNELLGSMFTITGDGHNIFFLTLSLLCSGLALLTNLKYKNSIFIHFMYVALIFASYYLLLIFNVSKTIIVFIVSAILLIANILVKERKLSDILAFLIPVFSIVGMFIIDDVKVLYSLIYISLYLINFLIIVFKHKDMESQIVSSILLVSFIGLIYFVLQDIVTDAAASIITISILSIIEMFQNYLNILKTAAAKIVNKILMNGLALIMLVPAAFAGNLEFLIGVLLLFVASFVNTFLIKNSKTESYVYPFKNIILFFAIFNYLIYDFNILPFALNNQFIYLDALLNITLVLFYKLTKNTYYQKVYIGLLFLVMLHFLFSIDKLTIIYYLISIVIFIFDYLVMLKNKKNTTIANIFFILIVLYAAIGVNIVELDYLKYIILSMSLAIILYFKRENKVCFGVTLPIFALSTIKYINSAINISSIASIANISLVIICLLLFSTVEFKRVKDQVLFTSITLSLLLVDMLTSADMAVALYGLVISVAMSIYGIKSNEYKPLYYLGLVFNVINLIHILNFIDNLPIGFYLLIVGVIFITITIFMIVRNKDREEEKEEKVITKAHYCGNCGAKVLNDDKYCGECGNIIE